jgi:hypothetical protein
MMKGCASGDSDGTKAMVSKTKSRLAPERTDRNMSSRASAFSLDRDGLMTLRKHKERLVSSKPEIDSTGAMPPAATGLDECRPEPLGTTDTTGLANAISVSFVPTSARPNRNEIHKTRALHMFQLTVTNLVGPCEALIWKT